MQLSIDFCRIFQSTHTLRLLSDMVHAQNLFTPLQKHPHIMKVKNFDERDGQSRNQKRHL